VGYFLLEKKEGISGLSFFCFKGLELAEKFV